MKRFLLLHLLLFALIFPAFSQSSKVTTGSKFLKVRVTSCEAYGNTCELSFLMENTSDREINLSVGLMSTPKIVGLTAIDDEGNIYSDEYSSGNFYYDGNKRLTLPPEIPIKGKIVIKNLPESIKMIRQLKMTEESKDLRLEFGKDYMIFSNIPIYREGDE